MRPDVVKMVDQQQMTAWGALSGDANPLHVDPAFGAASRYGGTIAHGHMVLAWVTEWLAAGGSPARLSGTGLQRLRFRAPVRPGHRYVVRGTERGVEIVDEQGDVVLTAEVLDRSQEDGHGKDA